MLGTPKTGRILMGRLPAGEDLLAAATAVCEEKGITAGIILVIGAVTRAKLLYYQQKKHLYTAVKVPCKPLEIASCTGNISQINKKTFIHAHAVLSDSTGKTYGGHLAAGTIIFAAEFFIQELRGIQLQRRKDISTGLNLWINHRHLPAKKPF